MRPSAHMAQDPSRISAAGPIGRGASDRRSPDRRSGGRGRGPVAARRARTLRRSAIFLVIPVLVGLLGGTQPGAVRADELSDARARQNALNQQLKDQKSQIAQINALQADLTSQIASTKRQLNGINADLTSVKASIVTMIKKINVVQAKYKAQ